MFSFLWLYFWNLILDYPMQGEFLGVQKANYNYLLFVHSAIWGLGIYFILCTTGYVAPMWKMYFLVFGHYIIDYLKCRKVGFMAKLNPLKGALYIDQLLHVLQILVVLTW